MAVKSLNAVLIDTTNGARLVAFYRELGLLLKDETHGSDPHWGCFINGMHFAIHQERKAASSSIAISFEVDDVDSEIARLRDKAVTIELEPTDRPFGRLASVRDPDGNLVYLHKYPAR
jgi:catechol 2,3-dioxygenase-like lactoylglutathione lyase family enzyme